MNYMKKIGSYLLLLVLSTGLASTLYAYDGKAAGSKRKYNSKVINRVSTALMDAIARNQTQRKKQYYIQDADVSRFFYAYFSSINASKLLSDDYKALKQDGYESGFNEYISTLRKNYLPEEYKDYQIYFVVAGLFYTPDITQTDVSKDLDWEKVRSVSFDKTPATSSTATPPFVSDDKKNNLITAEFEKRVQLGVYNNIRDKNLIKNVSIDFSFKNKTIVFYKWLLFDIDIEEHSIESFLKDDNTASLNDIFKAARPVIFMADGYMYNTAALDIKEDLKGLNAFLSLDGDYNDILHHANMPYQRNNLMKDITNAFIYFYQLSNSLIPEDFCLLDPKGQGKVLDILATSYKNAPTRQWEESPFSNPVLFQNISPKTRECIFEYLLNHDCGDGGANACEEMLVDAIGSAKTAEDKRKILEYFNKKDNFTKLYNRMDDWGGVDNYGGVVLALTSMAGQIGYWDTEKNSITDALFNFDKRPVSTGKWTAKKVAFKEEVKGDKGLHFEMVTTTLDYSHFTEEPIPHEQDPGPEDIFDCAPFTPVPFVYSDKLPYTISKPDGSLPLNGDIVVVPALYLQWMIRTDFKIDLAKKGFNALLVFGLYSGVGTLGTATTSIARLWAVGDIFFTSTLLVTNQDPVVDYIDSKYGKKGLEVLSTINTIAIYYGAAYMGRGMIKNLATRIEQKAFQETLAQMIKDGELKTTYAPYGESIKKVAIELDKAGYKLIVEVEELLPSLVAKMTGSVKSTYEAFINAGCTAEAKFGTVLIKNAKEETVALIYNNKITPTKWAWAKDFDASAKVQTSEGYIIIKDKGDVKFDLGFKEGGGRKLEATEANNYLKQGQGKDLDGQPYFAGTEVEEKVLGQNTDDIVYFVETKANNAGEVVPHPGQYASKDAITSLEELRQKLAVKKAWKPTKDIPTLRKYRVIKPLRTRSGLIGPQTDNGVKLAGGGHQYEVCDYLGNNWRQYLEYVGETRLAGVLIENLEGSIRQTFDDLIKAGLKAEEKAESILLKNANGETVAIIKENKLTPVKWGWAKDFDASAKVQTSEGYIIIKDKGDVKFDLGFKEGGGRKLEATETNNYLQQGQGKDGNGQPYFGGTVVEEKILGQNTDDIVYFVETRANTAGEVVPHPGQYASKDPISTLNELRQKLAVKAAWKPTKDIPTLRKYRVIKPLRTRSGLIGPQTENGVNLAGGGHQYEVYDYLGNSWNQYLEYVSESRLKGVLIENLEGPIKKTFDDYIKAGLKAEEEGESILLKNAAGETVAIIKENKLTLIKSLAEEKATSIFKVFSKEQLESLEPLVDQAVANIKKRGIQSKYLDVSKTDEALLHLQEGGMITVGDVVENPARTFLLQTTNANQKVILKVGLFAVDAKGVTIGGSLREIDAMLINRSSNVIEKSISIKLEPGSVAKSLPKDRKTLSIFAEVPENGSELRNWIIDFIANNNGKGLNMSANQISKVEGVIIKYTELGSTISKPIPIPLSEFRKYFGSANDFGAIKFDGISPETLGTTKQGILEGTLDLIRKKLLQ